MLHLYICSRWGWLMYESANYATYWGGGVGWDLLLPAEDGEVAANKKAPLVETSGASDLVEKRLLASG